MEQKTNNQAREEFETYITDHGIKAQFIAEKVGIPLSTLSKWRHGKMNFRVDKILKVLSYIRKN